jgi:CBS domain-containing protein
MLSALPNTAATGLDAEVREIMRAGVVTVSAGASLRRVAHALREHKVNAILVIGNDGAPLGWATVRGLLHNHARDWELADAGHAIAEPAVHVAPSATAREALAAMLDADVSRVLVVRPGDLAPEGVVAASDLVNLAAR